jgi:small subunit ribosomal protein S1
MDTPQQESTKTAEHDHEHEHEHEHDGEGEGDRPGAQADADAPQKSRAIDVEQIDDFGKALADYEAGLGALKEGEVVRGRVLRVLDKEVIVDVGYKSEGVIDIEEFRRVDGTVSVSQGDRVDVLLEKAEDADGYVVLSKEKAERLKVWD